MQRAMLAERLALRRTSPVRSSATEQPSAAANGSSSVMSGRPRPVSHLLDGLVGYADALGKRRLGKPSFGAQFA